MTDYLMMNTYDPQHLLMCEKEELVMYIQELRDDYDKQSKEHKTIYVKHMNDITRLEKENEKLKEEISNMEDEYIAQEDVNDWARS
jgi:cell division protein FtsB